ncbi:MAG: glycosyltransferase [Candidatus Kariarchaeaceae archaeon]
MSFLKHILFIVDTIPPTYGGLATSAHRIANYLAEDYQVIILTPSHEKSDQTIEKAIPWSEKIQIIQFKRSNNEAKYLEEYSRKGEKICEEITIEAIVGFYLYRAGFIATYLGKRYNIPTIVSARGNDIHRSLFHSKRHSFVKYALLNSTILTSVSTELIEKGQAFEEIKDKSLVVGNGVDFELFQRKEHKIQEAKKLVIGFAGDDRAKKGFHVIIKALSYLPLNLFDNFELFIAGSFNEDKLKNLLTKNCSELAYTFFGEIPREEMPSFYQKLDLLVIPSINDGLPNVLLEGIASGVNVVASKTGGIKDVLATFPENLFQSGDAEELTIILARFLQGEKNLTQRKEELLDHCKKQYSLNAEKSRWKKAISMAKE